MQIVLRLMMYIGGTMDAGRMALRFNAVCFVCVGVLAVLGVLFQALMFSFARCHALATAGQIFEGQGARSTCVCRGVGGAVAACPNRTDIAEQRVVGQMLTWLE